MNKFPTIYPFLIPAYPFRFDGGNYISFNVHSAVNWSDLNALNTFIQNFQSIGGQEIKMEKYMIDQMVNKLGLRSMESLRDELADRGLASLHKIVEDAVREAQALSTKEEFFRNLPSPFQYTIIEETTNIRLPMEATLTWKNIEDLNAFLQSVRDQSISISISTFSRIAEKLGIGMSNKLLKTELANRGYRILHDILNDKMQKQVTKTSCYKKSSSSSSKIDVASSSDTKTLVSDYEIVDFSVDTDMWIDEPSINPLLFHPNDPPYSLGGETCVYNDYFSSPPFDPDVDRFFDMSDEDEKGA